MNDPIEKEEAKEEEEEEEEQGAVHLVPKPLIILPISSAPAPSHAPALAPANVPPAPPIPPPTGDLKRLKRAPRLPFTEHRERLHDSHGSKSWKQRIGDYVLKRFPGMGEFMSRVLFNAPNAINKIQWSISEGKKFRDYYLSFNEDIIHGLGNHMWPISETYDYIITVDRVLHDMQAELSLLSTVNITHASSLLADIQTRVIRADYRPNWYHTVPLGHKNSEGIDITTGQVLGSELTFDVTTGKIRSKNLYELACDNAVLLTYHHMQGIVAISQGLFRVNLSALAAKQLNLGAGRNEALISNLDIPPGAWVNMCANGENIDIRHKSIYQTRGAVNVLAAQSTDLRQYSNTRFALEDQQKLYKIPQFPYRGTNAEPYATKPEGGAMATLWTAGTSLTSMVPSNTHAYVIDTDTVDKAARVFINQHPIMYVPFFREAVKASGILTSIHLLHMRLQRALEDVLTAKSLDLSDPTALHRVNASARVGCGKGAIAIYKDAEGNMVPEHVQTAKGLIRNPAIRGPKHCVPLVEKRHIPTLAHITRD